MSLFDKAMRLFVLPIVLLYIAIFLSVSNASASTSIDGNIKTDGILEVGSTARLMSDLEIGTTTPSPDGPSLVIVGNQPIETHSNYANGLYMYTHADADFRAPYINLLKSRGTQGVPTPVRYTGYEQDSIFDNSLNGVKLSGLGNGGQLQMTRGDGTSGAQFTILGTEGVGTSSPVANFQVANGANATTTMEVGSAEQNKGSCLKLYRTDGSPIYAYVAAGATTFTLTTTSCATVANF